LAFGAQKDSHQVLTLFAPTRKIEFSGVTPSISGFPLGLSLWPREVSTEQRCINSRAFLNPGGFLNPEKGGGLQKLLRVFPHSPTREAGGVLLIGRRSSPPWSRIGDHNNRGVFKQAGDSASLGVTTNRLTRLG